MSPITKPLWRPLFVHSIVYIVHSLVRDRFLEKEVWEPNSRGSRISKWGTRRRMGCGQGCPPPHWGRVWDQKKMWMLDLTRRILVQTGCFLYSSPKPGLNGVSTVKITLGTPFPGVPAGNDPWYWQ